MTRTAQLAVDQLADEKQEAPRLARNVTVEVNTEQAQKLVANQFPDLVVTTGPDGSDYRLTATIKPEAARKVQERALAASGGAADKCEFARGKVEIQSAQHWTFAIAETKSEVADADHLSHPLVPRPGS